MLRLAQFPALRSAMLVALPAFLAASAVAQTSFSAHTLFTTGSDTVRVVGHGDFNGDGREDLVASHDGTTQNGLLFLSNGDGTYDAPISLPVPIPTGEFGMAVGDFNDDGKLDFVTRGTTGSQLRVYLGNGDGTFQPAQVVADSNSSSEVLTWAVAADMNHDN